MLTACGQTQEEKNLEIRKVSTAKKVNEAKEGISNHFKDPDSVKLRNLTLHHVTTNMSDVARSTVCGEVNAKNGYGAYTGYKSFYYKDEKIKGVVEDDHTKYMYRIFCNEKNKQIKVVP